MALPVEIERALREAGLLRNGQYFVTPLAGGVSCDIWQVEEDGRQFAVKRALPKLRVQAEWFADPARNRHEQDYLKYVGKILPGSVPSILFSGDDFFAMEFLGKEFLDWKTMLLAGEIEPRTAADAGRTLGAIHRESWNDHEAEQVFDTDRHFHDLRIAPYLLASAEKHPEIAGLIHSEARRLASTKLALVHGDYSPKNLMVAPRGLVVLDCEVAWFGDPAFDLCFLLNHLLLKSLHLREKAGAILGLIPWTISAYQAEIGEPHFQTVSHHSPALLLCLLLARVDGKSPAEYLTAPEKKDFIRRFVHRHLASPPETLPELVELWTASLPL
jgi:aminoglycoside phosphotransferase (APT) family kinase protein